jgi:tRNA (uracil-5-)-methyltransferase TRM9
MKDPIVRRIAEINRDFYSNYAEPFSQTRSHLQPGVLRLLQELPADACILDIGCGSAQVTAWLADHATPHRYIGVDASEELLRIASSRELPFPAEFHFADLLSTAWHQPLKGNTFDRVFLFAVLHHIPGVENRLSIVRTIANLLRPNGQLWMSNWQFLRDPKLAARVIPWPAVGITAGDLEESDYLLDWRQGGMAHRYVHIIEEGERMMLAQNSGFIERSAFKSDGKSGDGSDYSIWEKAFSA